MLLLPSYVHLECPDSEPRRGPSSRQPDEVFAADVAGEQGGANLPGRTKIDSASHDQNASVHVTYRKPKHVSSGKEKAAHSIPVLPEHGLK